MSVLCPDCGKSFDNLGNHWQWNPSHRVNFSKKQLDIITGLMMGDGCLDTINPNPNVKVEMINKPYIKYLANTFGELSSGVKEENTNKITKYFTRAGLPEPSNYNRYESGCTLSFTNDNSLKLFEVMGEPLPGFEYKWPDRNL